MASRRHSLYASAPREITYDSTASRGWGQRQMTAAVIYRPVLAASPAAHRRTSPFAALLQTLAVVSFAICMLVLLVKLNAVATEPARFTLALFPW